MIVIDASLGVKWFFEEAGSVAALGLFKKHAGEISVPEIFAVEVASAFVRKANMQKSLAADMQVEINHFEEILVSPALAIISTSPAQLSQAATIAIDLGHPLKDCVYLVLAIRLGCALITCDAKFAERASQLWPHVQTLEPGL